MTFFDKQDKNSQTKSHGQKVTGQKNQTNIWSWKGHVGSKKHKFSRKCQGRMYIRPWKC